MAKIALVGSAPASVRLAPYGDPSWTIIGCSPGVYGIAPRVSEWFELHRWEPGQTWFSPEYCQWLAALPARGVKLWVGGDIPALPGSLVFPFDEILAIYDPRAWFCSSSLFWMMARAMAIIGEEAQAQGRQVDPQHDKIAFFGVDMAADSEYEMQRAGIHFMTYRAAAMGVEVGCPPESDLFTPRFRYGADEWTHSFVKMRARRMELEQRLAQAKAQSQAFRDQEWFLQGAIDDLKYCNDTWADKRTHVGITPVVAPAPPDIGQVKPGA